MTSAPIETPREQCSNPTCERFDGHPGEHMTRCHKASDCEMQVGHRDRRCGPRPYRNLGWVDPVEDAVRFVATTGTLPNVPRKRNELPNEWVERLRADQAAAAEAQERLKATVCEALEHGSVRSVHDVLGISTSTIMLWKAER